MPTCIECDEWVSEAFARVFGHPETGEVLGCISCAGRYGMGEVMRR
jgi:hypothetical protein